ncbi:MAG: terminase TerL endonuclease subunit [Dehalococcoidia bacterium]
MSTATLDFIRNELSLPDGRKLAETLPTDPWLVDDVLKPILATDDDGGPLHKLIYIELARGHYKTGSVANVAIAVALEESGTDVIAVASDLDQAALVHEAIDGQRERNPRLAAALVRTKRMFKTRNGSTIKIMSSDAPSALGIGVNCKRLRIICDELTQWPRADLYHAMATTLPKVWDSQLIIITNAGVSPGSAWQWGVRQAANEHGYMFTAEGTIASWIRPEDLEHVRATVPPPIYARFHENAWVEEASTFVPIELWDACADPALSPLRPLSEGERARDAEQVVIGVDAGVTGDCFAIVSVTRDPARPEDAVAVRDVAIWMPRHGHAIDFSEPWAHLETMCQRHNVAVIAYDPYQLHDFMQRFQRDIGYWCSPFDQGAKRAQADSDLFQLIRSKRTRHNGDPGLREHIANCGWKVAAQEDTRARLIKRGSGKIDSAVALSMSASECLRLLL